MDGIFNASLQKTGEKLIYKNVADENKYKEFVSKLDEGEMVEIFMEVNTGTGTLPQLAKVHKCIRVLSNHLGHDFEDMKIYIKDRAGLVINRKILGKEYFDWKSFADCSSEDLNLAIQACITMGDEFKLNLR